MMPSPLMTLSVGATSAMGASAVWVAHPMLALGLCIIAAVAGVVFYRGRSRKSITCRTARSTMGLAAGLAVGLFAYLENPETNNLTIIGIAFILGAVLDIAIPIIERSIPAQIEKYIGN